jgi:hypothetical protein
MKTAIKSFIICVLCIGSGVLFLFMATYFPSLEVVRNNIRTGVDADAYFYSEIDNFHQYEEAVQNRQEKLRRRASDLKKGD